MTDQTKPTPPKTELQTKIEARKHHERRVPLKGFPGLEKDAVVVRLLRKSDTNDALAATHFRIARLCEASPSLRESKDFVKDQETISLLFSAYRDVKDPSGMPAFFSPDWMEKHFDGAEISYLLRTYNAFAAEVHPDGSQHLGPDKLEPFLDWIASQEDTDAINDELLLFSPVMLGEALIRAAVLVRDARREAVEARQRLELLAAHGFVPPDDGEGLSAVSETLSIFATRLLAIVPQNDFVANSAPRIRTGRDAELVMTMLGWVEGSPDWRRVLGEEGAEKTS